MSARSGATINVRVIPRAGQTKLAGRRGDALLIRVAAAPVDDAANTELTAFLARLFDAPRRSVTIEAGLRGRDKRVRLTGLSDVQLSERLSTLLPV
jgi:uncharacterized protein YggU (UPF0235/DUF167 family)